MDSNQTIQMSAILCLALIGQFCMQVDHMQVSEGERWTKCTLTLKQSFFVLRAHGPLTAIHTVWMACALTVQCSLFTLARLHQLQCAACPLLRSLRSTHSVLSQYCREHVVHTVAAKAYAVGVQCTIRKGRRRRQGTGSKQRLLLKKSKRASAPKGGK